MITTLERLPRFRFHPDPVGSGSVVRSAKPCLCCRKSRGHVYAGPTYAGTDLPPALCPWCIADGSAHRKFAVTFVDSEAFDADAPEETITEICERTPGYCGFQPERWPSCCGSPATFISSAGIDDIRTRFQCLEPVLLTNIEQDFGVPTGAAEKILEALRRNNSPMAFVFQCEHCERHLGYVDYI